MYGKHLAMSCHYHENSVKYVFSVVNICKIVNEKTTNHARLQLNFWFVNSSWSSFPKRLNCRANCLMAMCLLAELHDRDGPIFFFFYQIQIFDISYSHLILRFFWFWFVIWFSDYFKILKLTFKSLYSQGQVETQTIHRSFVIGLLVFLT